MRILIVGGEGFIGHFLQAALRKTSHHVTVWDIKCAPESGAFADITDLQTFGDDASFDAVINLAAEHRDDVFPQSRYYEVNVKGAQNLCDWCEQKGIKRIIHASTVAVYGYAAPDSDEGSEHDYFNEYGRTKSMAETVCQEWVNAGDGDRRLTIIRPTVVFGPGNRGNVYNLLRQVASKSFVMIGDGKNIKSMAYVENVASFIVFCLDQPAGTRIYNYVDKPDLTMNELVTYTQNFLFGKSGMRFRFPKLLGLVAGRMFDAIAVLTGKSFPISHIRMEKFLATTQFRSNADTTGYSAPFSLYEGLDKTLTYDFLDDNADK